MVHIISNRAQEAYESTYAMLRRFGEQRKRKRQLDRDNERKLREESLFALKNTPNPHIQPEVPPLSGLACRYCSPGESKPQLDLFDRRRSAIDILRVTPHAGRRTNSSATDWGVWCPHLAQAARLKKYAYPQLEGAVLGEERVQEAIETAAKEAINEKRQALQGNNDEEATFDEDECYNEWMRIHKRRAQKLLTGMRSKLSDLALRITSYVLYKLLPRFISGVAAHPGQIDMIKRAIAANPDTPLIFLPLHRSHLDYIMVSFILLNNDIRCPLVAGGDNLRIPVFGNILRYDGAFFIKRKIDPLTGKKDHVYRAILHTYLQKCLTAGHNVEFFIEGGRTRTGKPCMPKSGILSVIVDAFFDKSIADALIVPMSINYEKLVDGNFVREQLGQPKVPESFSKAVAAIWKVLSSRYGLMRIDFNEPFALSQLVKSLGPKQSATECPFESASSPTDSEKRNLQHKPSSSSLFGTDVVQEEADLRTLVDNISRHVVFDCAKSTSIMTTNALAFLLLNRFREGATLAQLTEAMDNLRSVLQLAMRDLGFTGSSEDIIKYAAELLGPALVTRETRRPGGSGGMLTIKPVTLVPNVIELAYYSNCLVPHFALDSILVTCAELLHKERCRAMMEDDSETVNSEPEQIAIHRSELFRTSAELADLLTYEFILTKPCQSLDDQLDDHYDKLRLRELLHQPENQYNEEQQAARRLATRLEIDDLDLGGGTTTDDDEDSEYHPLCNRDELLDPTSCVYLPVSEKARIERDLLRSVLAPFIATYAATVTTLQSLLGAATLIEADFIRLCIREITGRVESGSCKYGESISTDTVRNCLKVLQKRSLIQVVNKAGVRLVSLTETYDSPQEVQRIIDSVERFV